MNVSENSKTRRQAADVYSQEVQKRYGDRIRKIILYGSVARDEDREDSDVDIFLIARDSDPQLQRELSYLAFDIGLEYGVEISALVFSQEHAQEYAQFSYFENVRSEGIEIG